MIQNPLLGVKIEVRIKYARQGRHGEGVHNVAENYYGTSAWDVRFFLLIVD